ncbi:hypothetical protein [Marasmitruncus massiliensis]|uniref:hypothetical protein n=1 Tax=Marasmitruncus massiliensis TaxID=1944642 RepID=UPI000C7B2BE6|nr:hypothetical protein [Marasmitruncus massiliensis]MBE6905755.1 hypothetical protein [Oscillospiraceae bacterium]
MNNNFNFSQNQLDALIRLAGRKMGTDPQKLKQQMESGQMDSVLKNLNANQQAQFKNLVNNPAAVQQLIENPNMQTLLKNLMGGK